MSALKQRLPLMQVAELLGVSHWTLRRAIKDGQLSATKPRGRVFIEVEEAERWMSRNPLGPNQTNNAA